MRGVFGDVFDKGTIRRAPIVGVCGVQRLEITTKVVDKSP